MNIVDYDQNTDEWKHWRNQGIGASDIPIIMGTNPYTTPYQLWEKKCGFVKDDYTNRAIQHGNSHESIAREWLNSHLNLYFKPQCLEDEEHPEFRASLDGYDESQDTLVEIKCPLNFSVIQNARITHSVPSYWLDQVIWQIMIRKPTKALLAVWDYENQGCILIEVMASQSRILEMRQKALEFWKLVKLGKPPAMTNTDYVEIEDDSLHELLLQYEDCNKKEKTYKDLKTSLKTQIVDYGDDGSFTCKGFKITRNPPRKTYDVQKMAQDGIDIEKYVKKTDSIGSYTIRCPNN